MSAVATKKYFREGKFGVWDPRHEAQNWFPNEKWVLKQFDWKRKLVLDIGVGAGRFSFAVAENGAQVIALDIYRRTVELVKNVVQYSFNNKISLLIADAEHLPFKRESFDVIICMETLMHLPNPHLALHEIRRVLRKGKFAVIQANNKFSFNIVRGVLSRVYKKNWHPSTATRVASQTRHYWTYSFPMFKRLLLNAGFKILSSETCNPIKFKMTFITQK